MSHGTSTAAVTAALCLFSVFPLEAASAPDVTWQGIIRSNDGKVVRASVRRTGDIVATHVGEPYNCKVFAELVDEDKDHAQFRFRPAANGGLFCQSLYPGEMHVSSGSGAIDVRFDAKQRTWQGSLTSAGQP